MALLHSSLGKAQATSKGWMMGVSRETSVYQIRIRGHLDSSWSTWLDGATVLPQPDGETMLCVSPDDQTALWAILSRLWDLGLPLIRVEWVSDGTTPQETVEKAPSAEAADVRLPRKDVVDAPYGQS